MCPPSNLSLPRQQQPLTGYLQSFIGSTAQFLTHHCLAARKVRTPREMPPWQKPCASVATAYSHSVSPSPTSLRSPPSQLPGIQGFPWCHRRFVAKCFIDLYASWITPDRPSTDRLTMTCRMNVRLCSPPPIVTPSQPRLSLSSTLPLGCRGVVAPVAQRRIPQHHHQGGLQGHVAVGWQRPSLHYE